MATTRTTRWRNKVVTLSQVAPVVIPSLSSSNKLEAEEETSSRVASRVVAVTNSTSVMDIDSLILPDDDALVVLVALYCCIIHISITSVGSFILGLPLLFV